MPRDAVPKGRIRGISKQANDLNQAGKVTAAILCDAAQMDERFPRQTHAQPGKIVVRSRASFDP